MTVTISDEIKGRWPETALGVLVYQAQVEESSPQLLEALRQAADQLAQTYALDTIAKNPHIAATRQAYKALGTSPHEHRNAAEAMLRRVVKGSGLYHINNVVEVNNLISISSGYSIGSYDLDQLQGELCLDRPPEDTRYEGIGKGALTITHMPVLRDGLGWFGNPSSDSRRAMIQPGKRRICSVIYGFDGEEALAPWLEKFEAALRTHCGAEQVEKQIVG